MLRYATEFVFPNITSRDPDRDRETTGYIDVDDGGQALIAEVTSMSETNPDGLFFVRLQSWSEGGSVDSHTLFNSLRGKRVRVTVETLD